MAVLYTVQDIEAYKAVMTRHAAKNNRLIEKWKLCRTKLQAELSEIETLVPSTHKDYSIQINRQLIRYCNCFIDDLELPADAEISDFEWRNCK